jgi:hypothetical protein
LLNNNFSIPTNCFHIIPTQSQTLNKHNSIAINRSFIISIFKYFISFLKISNEISIQNWKPFIQLSVSIVKFVNPVLNVPPLSVNAGSGVIFKNSTVTPDSRFYKNKK